MSKTADHFEAALLTLISGMESNDGWGMEGRVSHCDYCVRLERDWEEEQEEEILFDPSR